MPAVRNLIAAERDPGSLLDVKLQGFGYPERPTGGPDWSVQLQVKLLFPK